MSLCNCMFRRRTCACRWKLPETLSKRAFFPVSRMLAVRMFGLRSWTLVDRVNGRQLVLCRLSWADSDHETGGRDHFWNRLLRWPAVSGELTQWSGADQRTPRCRRDQSWWTTPSRRQPFYDSVVGEPGAAAMLYMYVQCRVSFKFQRPQITVVTSHPCYDTVILNPNNETELHGIAVVLLCDELTVWRDAYVTSWPVPSWSCYDITVWRDDRVTSWLVAVVDRDVGCIGVGLVLALHPAVVLSSYSR